MLYFEAFGRIEKNATPPMISTIERKAVFLAVFMNPIFVSLTRRIMFQESTPLSRAKWTMTRVNTRAENIEVRMPTMKVVAKPRTGPEPNL